VSYLAVQSRERSLPSCGGERCARVRLSLETRASEPRYEQQYHSGLLTLLELLSTCRPVLQGHHQARSRQQDDHDMSGISLTERSLELEVSCPITVSWRSSSKPTGQVSVNPTATPALEDIESQKVLSYIQKRYWDTLYFPEVSDALQPLPFHDEHQLILASSS
jgi:hypothetical protein